MKPVWFCVPLGSVNGPGGMSSVMDCSRLNLSDTEIGKIRKGEMKYSAFGKWTKASLVGFESLTAKTVFVVECLEVFGCL